MGLGVAEPFYFKVYVTLVIHSEANLRKVIMLSNNNQRPYWTEKLLSRAQPVPTIALYLQQVVLPQKKLNLSL